MTPSFYSPVPDRDRADDLFGSYLSFLEQRNGELHADDGFEKREQLMTRLPGAEVRFSAGFEQEVFNRNYEKLIDKDLTLEQFTLLAFVKMNAGEAYGVEVMREARADLMARPEPIFMLEKILSREEDYHTRLLVGAVDHVDGLEVTGAWRPAWPLKLLILCLSKAPRMFFHPVLLGAEISGVFTVTWLLTRLKDLFPDDPLVRESMEQRLMDVLIDEIGHVAYNRICIGTRGFGAAKYLAGAVCESHDQMTRELIPLGYQEARKTIASFDFMDLPEEARRNAWFV